MLATALEYHPDWEPPDPDELSNVTVDSRLAGHVEEFHVGLKTINIKGAWEEAKQKRTQQVCGISITGSGRNKIPGISPTMLSQLIYARATEHAAELKTDVSYAITYYGENDDLKPGKPFQVTRSFKIDTSEDEEEDDDEEEDEEEGKVKVVDKNLGPPRTEHKVMIENELVEMLRLQREQSAAIFAELRLSTTEITKNLSSAMQAQSKSYHDYLVEVREYLGSVREDLNHSRGESTKANQHLVKISEHTLANSQGQQEANRKGWEAFTAGMQMQLQAMGQNISWERQFMHVQMEQMTREKTKDAIETGKGWLKDFGPFLLAAWGQLLTSRGNTQGGSALQEMAIKAMEGDDEDEEEDEVKVKVKVEEPKKPVMGVPPQVDVREHFENNQINSMLQLFNSMLSDKQKKKLQELVPPVAWDTLQAAINAKNDMMTRVNLIQFAFHIGSTPGLADQLKQLMTSEQAELYADIGKLIEQSLPSKPQEVAEAILTKPEPPAPPAPPEPPAPKKRKKDKN
jgi:hypothetical protein